MAHEKYYVIWQGAAPGVYDSWEEARLQVEGYPNAAYRSFRTKEEAVEAFRAGYDKDSLIAEVARQVKKLNREGRSIEWQPDGGAKPYIVDSIAVDAACSGNPGPMEYRGVLVRTGQELFHFGPVEGTNNIGEFLAIVHCLALQEKQGTRLPIYSDSVNAQKWVRMGLCRTKLECTERNRPLFDLIRRAEAWLRQHRVQVPIYKWETKAWGEIPADFGRK
jgi:ribonuclease HI